MRADWTASGACISGSTAPPRGVTRRVPGGAATTSTASAEPTAGVIDATGGRPLSKSGAAKRQRSGNPRNRNERRIAMKLYGFGPTRSLRALWGLRELGVDFEFVPVNLRAGEHHRPEFLALNPA